MATQRAKVPPFKRDSIDLARHGKSWRLVKVAVLLIGDNVKGFGPIDEIEDRSEFHQLDLVFVTGKWQEYDTDAEVEAFVEENRGLTTATE